MAVFRENRGLNINFYFQNPQKAHPCVGPRLLTYLAWRSVLGSGLYSLAEEPKNEHFRRYISPIWGEKNLVESAQNFALGRYPGRNHRCKFGGRSTKPYFRGEGSNFRLFHRLSQSSLQHSRTTVKHTKWNLCASGSRTTHAAVQMNVID